jgi:N6-L-threonylcarbamoyladenine synthase
MRPTGGASRAILAIESSCDETAAAVVREDGAVLGEALASQVDLHARFGGVVPEIASRSHQEIINPVIDEALEMAGIELCSVDALAVTQGPGLPGALMVGLATAKALAFGCNKPLIGVNHLEGHIFANRLEHPELKPPFVTLVVSGGHTMLAYVKDWGDYEVLGRTLDDAAGEAFDKVASFLGLGYPGGPVIERLAAEGDPEAVKFPRAMISRPDYDFSLSGLKTAVLYYVSKKEAAGEQLNLADIAAGFQAAVIDVQVHKAIRAAKEKQVSSIVLAGGVAANRGLRKKLEAAAAERGWRLYYPSLRLCTDNAVMIGLAAWHKFAQERFLPLDAQAEPNMSLS